MNIDYFLGKVGSILDQHMGKFDNLLLLGDFNCSVDEGKMNEFCDIYNLQNLISDPTCFKNPLNPSSIDLILTNKRNSFLNSQTIETGLSDFHKMTITVLKSFFQKQEPVTIKYRDYKGFDNSIFRAELNEMLNDTYNKNTVNYKSFELIFMILLNKHAPMREKYVRANNAPFMNKVLSKAVMNRSRLRNRFLKNPTIINKTIYNKHRNYCVNLFRREKRKYFDNLDLKMLTDNKKFWKLIKPLFSDKHNISRKITLIESDDIISNDVNVAEVMNKFFSNAVENLDITGYFPTENISNDEDNISKIIYKYKDHPSILKIKELDVKEKFSFTLSSAKDIESEINKLNTNKPTTFNNIPAKILVENCEICSSFISKIYNDSILNTHFPDALKRADITPIHKKDERTSKENYRPVSILPSISKIFERNMYDQIYNYINKYLSHYLCGFRKSYNTQHCLIAMLEKWRKALDKHKLAGALLTDLSKAFDCLNHELLIAKLAVYGFDYLSLAYIFSYLTDRKQRTKVNNYFSTWSDIKSGIPQGSIIGPLLFNIYINDIFFFVNESDLTNYADDNTPYAIEYRVNAIITSLENKTGTLMKWFNNNYFKMNANKCQLLITNHENDVSVNIDGQKIECSKSVKLLGVCIDNKLDFNEHVSNICKKVSKKLHALRRVSHLMNKDKLRIIMKSFIESQFGYCPLVWMFHSRQLNNRINILHEKALRLVYSDNHLSFEKLLELDNSFTIHHRNLQRLATEMFKVKNDLSPMFMKKVFPESTNPYNLREPPVFKNSNVRSVYNGTETISFRGPKTWSLVPNDIKLSKSLPIFKEKIRRWKPVGCMCRICKTYIQHLGFI